MSFPSSLDRRLRRLVPVGALLACGLAAGAAPQVQPFDSGTWNALRQASRQPAVAVFSTTDCVHCPHTVKAIADTARRLRSPARLVVVVMDGQGQERALLSGRHYRGADALYVFADDATRLRFTVNPDWRGLTPYVALISIDGETRFFAGTPPDPVLRDFLMP